MTRLKAVRMAVEFYPAWHELVRWMPRAGSLFMPH
jgi:hypothetical protein